VLPTHTIGFFLAAGAPHDRPGDKADRLPGAAMVPE
jgi:hypothetical protein